MSSSTYDAQDLCARAGRHTSLTLLVLYGSRASGRARTDSDWDFGYLAGADFDPEALRVDLALALGSDAIDLVDLARAGGLLRYRVARDGRLLFEHQPGGFDTFRLEAIRFWCDAEPVLRRAYDAVLEQLR